MIKNITILFLLLFGVGNVLAYEFQYPFIYFNNSNSDGSQRWNRVMILFGHDGASQGIALSQISNTNLWFVKGPDWGTTIGSFGYGFSDLGAWDFYDNTGIDARWTTLTGQTSNYTGKVKNNASYNLLQRTYYFTSSGTNNLEVAEKANNGNWPESTLPEYSAYLKIKKSEDGGSSYPTTITSGTWPGSFTLQGTKIKRNGDQWSADTPYGSRTGDEAASATTSGSQATYDNNIVTGLITMTRNSTTDAAYEFTGWGTGDSPTSTGDTKEYHITGTTTYFAFFKRKQFTVTFDAKGTKGESTVTAEINSSAITSGSLYNYGSAVSFTATPSTGYKLNSPHAWWSDAACTSSSLENGTSTTYSIASLTSAKSVYVKFVPKSCSITLDYQSSAPGYNADGSGGNQSSLTATYDADMTTMTGTMPVAKDGWAFMGFYSGMDGTGTKYYNDDGTSAHKWDIDTESATTLYAFYKKAEITALTFDPTTAIVNPGATIGVTPTISPEPTGDHCICWHVLHNNGNPLSGGDPTFTPVSGNKVSFPAPSTAGTYLVACILREGTTCSGTIIDSVTASFQAAGEHTVIIQYKDGDGYMLAPSVSVTAKPLDWSTTAITPPDIFGYSFSRWDAGDGVTLTDDGGSTTKTTTTTSSIKIKAIYEGKLTAVYTQKNIIYFKNTLGWNAVYVNLYPNGWWNASQGAGNQTLAEEKCNKPLTRIGESDIWYYEYGNTSVIEYVSFTDRSQSNKYSFSNTTADPVKVCYPTIPNPKNSTSEMSYFGFYSKTPMFVPASNYPGDDFNSNLAKYYSSGYWTKYTPGTGYYLRIYDPNDASKLIKKLEFTSENDLIPMTVTANLEANKTYYFEVAREDQQYYSNGSDTPMDYSNRYGQGTAWELFRPDTYKKTKFKTTADGDYIFHLTYAGNQATHNNDDVWRLRISAEYPIAPGDYRLLYKDKVHTAWHPSAIIPHEAAKDTVSFFVRTGQNAELKLQKCTAAGTSSVTWEDTVANLFSGGLPAIITKDSVYNFCFDKDASNRLRLSKTEVYTGKFYIRVDCANSKWDNWRTDPDHLMNLSEYSITHGGYSHYYCHWVQTDDRKNIKFCVANDYSPCISDTLTRETASGTWANIATFINTSGDILRNANVRFMWNRHDNTVSRAYIDGAQESGSSNFLVLTASDSKIFNPSTEAVQTTTAFTDNQNWIYEATVKAQPNALIKLKSTWGEGTTIVQYFKGSDSESEYLIQGSGTTKHTVRLIYDFKTNRLVTAMIPSGYIETDLAVHADVMFIREHQGDIAQLTFAKDAELTDIQTAYGVMRFNKWTLNNKDKDTHNPLAAPLSRYERDLFYISFPFRVNLNEVFGFGTYGKHWILEEYDGEARAANGYWEETPSYWRFITDRRDKILEPGKGYLLALDLDELGEESSVWAHNTENVELYFPSSGTMPDITGSSVTYEIPSHKCTIDRTGEGLPDEYNRTIKDSHWNIIGVPTYVNTSNTTFANDTWITTHGPAFLYTWNSDDNTLTATSGRGYTYKAMHAYTVQYCGNLTWNASVSPYSPIVARRTYEETPSEVEFEIELQQNDKMVDRTFVRLSDDDDVSADFVFGEDMSKNFNANKANVYTFIGEEPAAGNTLPMTGQTTIVPMGVKIATAGTYTISIPSGTYGIGVTLIDEQTGVRTSLSAMDYIVELDADDYTNRFFLEIAPIKTMPTDIENVQGDNVQGTKARKIMIDGILYIRKDGKIYDARGVRIQ